MSASLLHSMLRRALTLLNSALTDASASPPQNSALTDASSSPPSTASGAVATDAPASTVKLDPFRLRLRATLYPLFLCISYFLLSVISLHALFLCIRDFLSL